jgi:hypothetical protein
MFFDEQELDVFVESLSYCGAYGVAAWPVAVVYLNSYVVGPFFTQHWQRPITIWAYKPEVANIV